MTSNITSNIKGYPGYSVDPLGNVYNIYGAVVTQHSDSRRPYKYISIRNKKLMVHRLVAEAFVPNPSNKLQVNHIDGDKSHNYWLNLEWVSNQENMAHAFKTGLNKNEFGENSRRAILTQSQVNAIRHAVNNGASQTYLASMYGVSRSTINKIARGISWKSMEKDDDK